MIADEILVGIVRKAALIVACLSACACSPLKMFDTLVPKDSGSRRVAEAIPYGAGPRRMLDIYAPTTAPVGRRPVVIFFYGGSWADGTRTSYSFVGRAFAAKGFVTVVLDYRLVPEVRYPGFVEDGAAAVRWVERHAAHYGGDRSRIVLIGHSAGAYIAAMLALDERWLGADRAAIRGFVGLAGPYDFAPFDARASKDAFGKWPRPAETQPVTWASRGDPPSLLLVGDADQTVRPRNSVSLVRKLSDAGVLARIIHYPKLGHVGIATSIARPFRGRAPVLSDAVRFASARTR